MATFMIISSSQSDLPFSVLFTTVDGTAVGKYISHCVPHSPFLNVNIIHTFGLICLSGILISTLPSFPDYIMKTVIY